MYKLLSAIFGALVFFLLATTPISAAAPSITGAPPSLTGEQEFSVQVTLTIGSSAGKKYYLRGAFAHPDDPPSPSPYFGYTKNLFHEWYNGSPSEFTRYREIEMTTDNTWSGIVEAKPDLGSSKFKGSGTYIFKIGYYRESGSFGEWSNPVQIAISASSTPTPTPSPTPTPTPTPSPTPAPTSTPKPSPTSSSTTSTTSKTPTPTPSPKPTGIGAKLTDSTKKSNADLVLGVQESPVVEGTESGASTTEEGSNQGRKPFLAIGLIALGTIFLGIAAYAFLRERSSGKIKVLDEKIS